MIPTSRHLLAILSLLIFAFALPGCGYTLYGKVLRGDSSAIDLLHDIDQRHKQPGLANVEIVVRRNPKDPNPERVGRTRTDAAGNFSMSIKEFGAGWMEEQWLVQARLPEYQNASAVMKLPARNSKWGLLITLAPGTATPLDTHEEITEDFERFK
jgi:hypothetical protein